MKAINKKKIYQDIELIEGKLNTKVGLTVFTKEELDVLIWILNDWQDIMSDLNRGFIYPNNSITSTQLITFLNTLHKSLV